MLRPHFMVICWCCVKNESSRFPLTMCSLAMVNGNTNGTQNVDFNGACSYSRIFFKVADNFVCDVQYCGSLCCTRWTSSIQRWTDKLSNMHHYRSSCVTRVNKGESLLYLADFLKNMYTNTVLPCLTIFFWHVFKILSRLWRHVLFLPANRCDWRVDIKYLCLWTHLYSWGAGEGGGGGGGRGEV